MAKKPDELAMIPWRNDRPPIWDFSCADTLAKTYLKGTCKNASDAARKRESDKKGLYQDIETDVYFIPVCLETLGSWGELLK